MVAAAVVVVVALQLGSPAKHDGSLELMCVGMVEADASAARVTAAAWPGES